MLDKVRPYLRTLFAATARCTAGVAVGAAFASASPFAGLALIGFAAAMLLGQAAFESFGAAEQRAAVNELKRLVLQYGDVEAVVAKLAAGEARFRSVTSAQAQQVLALLRASDEQIEQLFQQNDGLTIYSANWLGERVTQFGESILQELAGLSGAIERHDAQSATNHAKTHAGLAAINTRLDQLFADKSAGETAPHIELSAAEQALVAEARRRGDAVTKSKAALAQGDFPAHREYLAQAMMPVLAEAFELLTLEGDGYYFEGRFDDAVLPYEKAHSLRPSDFTACNNLALALLWASRLPRAADIDRAIQLLAANLHVQPPGTPAWAATQNNLGIAWRNLPTGDRGQNLAHAIECYKQALEVRTRAARPVAWAMTQHNLGTAWQNLPTGDRGQNLAHAIECYTQALEVHTRAAHPVAWAATQNNLGTAWRDLPTGDRGQNLAHAIACYQQALEVYTRAAHPVDWAMTQNNLGIAWADLPTGDRGQNLVHAIECYKQALEVYTRAAHPVDWATTQNNLGIAWRNLPTGDRGQNLTHAIECFNQALEVRTRAAHPVAWAATQNNLGNAWRNLPTGDPGQNLAHAIECYDNALEIYTPAAFPHYHALVSTNRAAAQAELDRGANS